MGNGKSFTIREKITEIAGVFLWLLTLLWIADVICFKNYGLPLEANFQQIKCNKSHNFDLGNYIKAICCVKTIEVANEVIREYEIKTGTKYSIQYWIQYFLPKVFGVVE